MGEFCEKGDFAPLKKKKIWKKGAWLGQAWRQGGDFCISLSTGR